MQIGFQLFFLVSILMGAVIHEYSHGWMAWRYGDDTAKVMGRLTLNPIVHIDPFGTILLPLLLWVSTGGSFLFAYAKPVPVNFYRLRDQKIGPAAVAFAGPGANILTAVVFGLMIRFLPLTFNPVFITYLSIIVYANLLLAVFNLVPIPPLDGSRIVDVFLPQQYDHIKRFLHQYGFILLIFFILFLFRLILPIISFLFYIITGYHFM